MSTVLLTIYVLVWPIIVAGVLYVLVHGFANEFREAKREGRRII